MDADGVDFREVLYGAADVGGPSLIGRVRSSGEGAPSPHTGSEHPRGPTHRSSPWMEETPSPRGGWASTRYGDWLLASSSSASSARQPLLLSDQVQRVGKVQRLRDAASYRGPPGISQPRQPRQGPPDFSVHADNGHKENAYLGAVGGAPYVGAVGGSPACMPPSPSIHGNRYHPRETSERLLDDFDTPQDLREQSADVYVLAPDGDTGFSSGRGVPFSPFVDVEGPPSIRRRTSFAASEQYRLGGLPSASEEVGHHLEGPPLPFERLSPLDVSKGPLKKREATDVWCLFLLIACWSILMWLVIPSLFNKSPQRLNSGIDWLGRVCGIDEGVKELPYVYWPSKTPPSGPVDHELDSCSLLPIAAAPAQHEQQQQQQQQQEHQQERQQQELNPQQQQQQQQQHQRKEQRMYLQQQRQEQQHCMQPQVCRVGYAYFWAFSLRFFR
ncbi:hypothetical protein ACSSS7_004642 [Eimeria intestinalis]